MADTLTTKQNDPAEIKRLWAQRNLYSQAKRVVGLQMALTTLVPVAGMIAEVAWPQLKGGVAFYGVVVSVLDVAVLDPWQKGMRYLAAKIQEAFDCSVLDLPWNDFKVGSRPEGEDVQAASSARRGNAEDEGLQNWYPVIVAEVPLSLGRIICQRSNLRWDAALRRRYRTWLAGMLILFGVIVSYLGLHTGFSLEQLTLGVLAPISPMLLWGIREFQRHGEAASLSDRLREKSVAMWTAALNRKMSEEELKARARQLQDEIYDRRSNAPMIFNWVYNRLRDAGEEQMNVAASELVTEAKSHGF